MSDRIWVSENDEVRAENNPPDARELDLEEWAEFIHIEAHEKEVERLEKKVAILEKGFDYISERINKLRLWNGGYSGDILTEIAEKIGELK